MIKLQKEIVFAFDVMPACLYTNLSDLPQNMPLIVTGWGRTHAESKFSNAEELALRFFYNNFDKKNECTFSRAFTSKIIRQLIFSSSVFIFDFLSLMIDDLTYRIP